MATSNWPFTVSNCTGYTSGYDEFYQIATDYMSNNGGDPYAFSCDYDSGHPSNTNATSVASCSSAALCIGPHGKQHACSIFNKCFLVDWTSGFTADPCNSNLIDYLNVQPLGMNTPCCGSDFCTKPKQQSGLLNQCTSPQNQELWLCVNDGKSAECVRTRDNAICAGNLTNPTQTLSSTHTSSTRSQSSGVSTKTTSPASTSSSSSNTGSSDSTWKIAVSAALAGTAVIVVALIICFKRRKNHYKPQPPSNFFPEGNALGYRKDYSASGVTMPTPSPGAQVLPAFPTHSPGAQIRPTFSGNDIRTGRDFNQNITQNITNNYGPVYSPP